MKGGILPPFVMGKECISPNSVLIQLKIYIRKYRENNLWLMSLRHKEDYGSRTLKWWLKYYSKAH
ncbi:MAG: hypothetical protein ACJAXJ_003321 [Colwellia sp.]